MVLDAAVRVSADAVEHFHHRTDFDGQTGFLQHFPRDRLFQRLADLHGAAGKTPLSFEGGVSALDQQHAIAVEDDGADADHRPVRIRFHDDSPRTRRARTCRPRLFTLTSTE